MLKHIHLKNLALIKETEFDLNEGLNIMTGETGSGKSIIIGAINIALGEKANKSMIRNGAEHAFIELQFLSKDARVKELLQELSIEPDGDSVFITRKISADSSVARVNGETITLANLKRLTSLLVDVHGQHEHQSLLDASAHLNIVDHFAGLEAAGLKAQMRAEYQHYKDLRKEYAAFSMDEASLEREKELLAFEINEIEEAQLKEGEDAQLEADYRRMSSAGEIRNALGRMRANFDDDADGAISKIQDAMRQLDHAVQYDESLKEMRTALIDLDSIAKDLSADLSRYLDQNALDEETFAYTRKRLDQINHLKSRYGNSIPEILEHAQKSSEQLEKYADYDASKETLSEEIKKSVRELNILADQLSEVRKVAALRLEPLILSHLKDLNFADIRFAVQFEKMDKISVTGYDKVEFMLSANPGEPLAPLSKVASGGELSRIMLAIKSSAADADKIPTMIFDEIDTGISGLTAQKVAEKLSLLSTSSQVLAITHLPQIAAMADHHYRIQKAVEDGTTISGIYPLTYEQMLMEVARIVGGAEVTDAAFNNAKDLKESADAFKKSLEG